MNSNPIETSSQASTNAVAPKSPSAFAKKAPGVVMVAIIALLAQSLGKDFPLIGGAVIAIVIGVLIKNYVGVPKVFSDGISYTLKKLLKLAIVLLGLGLSFAAILEVGLISIIIVVVSVTLGILLTFYIAKAMGLDGNIPLLVGVGTGICGATAIATAGPVIKAKEAEIAYSVNIIFAFNVLAVLAYPLIGQFIGLPDNQFGVWAGAAIHDTSSVVAAGYSYSDSAGEASVVVKLLRTLMLVPVAVLLSLYIAAKMKKEDQNAGGKSNVKISKIFPYFILVFAGAAILNTFFPLPTAMTSVTDTTAKFIIIMVMASVGLGTDFKKIKSVGLKPLFVGMISSVIIGIVSLSLVLLLI